MYELPFRRGDGSPLRPWGNAAAADRAMLERWNALVQPSDKVYVLGDLMMGASGFDVLAQLNGTKVLIMGNHESHNVKRYVPYFKDIRSCHMLDGFVLTHIPVHPDCLGKATGNVHGHLHYRSMLLPNGSVDPRYLCVCVEHTDYAPISWGEVRRRFTAQQV